MLTRPKVRRFMLLLVAVVLASHCACRALAQTSDPTLNALIKKGLLTEQEAKAALAEREEQAKKATLTDKNIRVFWKDGLNFESGDKKFKGKFGGRIDLDAAVFSEDSDVRSIPGIGDIPAGTEFRRARLSLEGEYRFSAPAFYKVELDFAEADVAFKDVYLGLSEIPAVGKFQAGHFKEPSSLEGLTSSRFLMFLERSLPVEAFWPERNTGIMLANTLFNERTTWALGGFTSTELRAGVDGGTPLDSDYRVVGRLTGLPFYDAESKGARFLHLGVSGTVVGPENGVVRFRSRPEAHLAPRLVDTGNIAADNQFLLGTEALFVWGPFSLQGEYFYTWLDRTTADTAQFSGYYVAGSWFITGEHRTYKASTATIDRLSPKHSLSFDDGGLGAWELAVRYSSLDLNDSGITGGRLNDITGGLNWYLNPNMKIQFNYVYSMLDRTVSGVNHDGNAHSFQTRLHVDF